ncbi:MAG: hypothetical protein ACRD3A_13210 [Terriglobales bacterium]
MSNNDIVALLALLAFLAAATSLLSRGEAIRHALRRLIACALAASLTLLGLTAVNMRQQEALIIGGIVGVVMFAAFPKRRRYVRRSERKKAIARFERETGKRYNPRLHELDHEVPFSRGGSSTADNLRVIGKRANRRKGARLPWWDILGVGVILLFLLWFVLLKR